MVRILVPGCSVYPCLLRDLAIARPNQVWSTDITYVRLALGYQTPDNVHQSGQGGGAMIADHFYNVLPKQSSAGQSGAAPIRCNQRQATYLNSAQNCP